MKQFLLLAVWQLVEADWAFGTPFFIATTMCMISLHLVQTFLHLSTKRSSWFVLIFVAFTRVLSVWPSSSRSTTVANRTAGEQLAGQLESTRQVWGVIHSLQLGDSIWWSYGAVWKWLEMAVSWQYHIFNADILLLDNLTVTFSLLLTWDSAPGQIEISIRFCWFFVAKEELTS